MNADVARMNVKLITQRVHGCVQRRHEGPLHLLYVHLRYICAHLRFQSLFLIAATILLTACGTAPKKAAEPAKPGVFGKYYADDGPPEKVPENMAQIPDAVPRDEPFHRYANRPYTVFGHTYVPVVNKDKTKERGLASWYGRMFHGRKTASGEVYD